MLAWSFLFSPLSLHLPLLTCAAHACFPPRPQEQQFLLAARRRKKTKSPSYVIATSETELTRDSDMCVAKVRKLEDAKGRKLVKEA
jgi:hypothetical protein